MSRIALTIGFAVVSAFAGLCTAGSTAINSWLNYGGNSSRTPIAVDGPDTVSSSNLAWVAGTDPWDPVYAIDFEWASTPVLHAGKVFAYAHYYDSSGSHVSNQVIAFDCQTGDVAWATVVDKAYMDSWSSPAIDTEHNLVLIGSGTNVYALDIITGQIQWQTALQAPVVNASVCIADDLDNGRAYITDYTGYSDGGRLYCINLDPNDVDTNPYEPGEIVWSDSIGATSGNSPAYKDGTVYVACVSQNSWDGEGSDNGAVFAYDADADQPVRVWQTSSSQFEGFFGAVTVTKEGFLYAANYDFYGTGDNSALCKIDCADGSIVWVTQTERTNSTPVVVADTVYICGGVNGYGSRPKVQAFRDQGSNAVKLWETPETMSIGGSTNQVVYANGKLYVGGRQADEYSFDPYSQLFILDADKTPADPGFIISRYSGCGSSSAATYDSVYSIGYDGLHKFYQPGYAGDINDDGTLDHADILLLAEEWTYDGAVGLKRSDLNLDGRVDMKDQALIAGEWNR
ncbi:outer membrane biogenesis protein BamB [Anaerohalosphaera lusitana]|uniref:Outer membrane biogenesis protein BamB n=1 Tax=Anaerohalosphaera lusitana TaxID=1936003 RepID=A0A1U9NLD7_9BACT|nr:PQQ-binding-like beta-propeller repeat protein [Anaerohalosphaera lusitana]AQT68548.1 outer membrane biogenesis protein BamB [Anaerohalosphaera lusitana]